MRFLCNFLITIFVLQQATGLPVLSFQLSPGEAVARSVPYETSLVSRLDGPNRDNLAARDSKQLRTARRSDIHNNERGLIVLIGTNDELDTQSAPSASGKHMLHFQKKKLTNFIYVKLKLIIP